MAAMTSSTSSEGGLRFFSGDSEDGREYKRWKQWVKNKLLTLDKLAEGSRGAYIYTLLSGKALEAVEHLDPESYQKKGGDDALWAILDKRFPQQETVDELGEILTEIFGLRSHEGESMRQWTARASELMDKCHRKTGVSFPDEARGWLLLHRAALSEEQKAVVIARARGDLKRESIASALRSCYPELVMTRKRAGVAIAEEQDGGDDTAEIWDDGFSDIEQLLEDHHAGVEAGPDTETFQESEELDFVASVMATPTLLERVRKHVNDKSQPDVPATTEEILLVSSPGYGVLDSGCGRTIVGQTTLRAFEKIWKQKGWAIPKPIDEVHQFKFGNGEVETSMVSIQMPVVLAHRRGVIRAAVIKGDAPLLLSRTALKTLGATLDFAHDSLQVFGKTIPLQTNSAGQYVVQLTGEDSVCSPAAAFTEVMASVEASPGPTASHEHVDEPQLEPEMPVANAPELISPTAPDTAIWEQEDCDVVTTPWLSRQGPAWKHVFRRSTVEQELTTEKPRLLVLCPPCTDEGHEAPWTPAAWRSYRLQRAVSSTLAAEGQAMSVASGTAEWILLLLAETIDGPLQIRDRILERSIEVPASQRFPPSLTMAGTSQRLSSAVDELLQRVRDEGSMDSLLKELGYELGEFELVRESEGQGSMTDASKRRMVDEASPLPQRPMVRAAKTRASSKLPSGVSSMEEWGRTLVTAGKFEKHEISHSELASSSETSKVKYVQWMINQSDRSDLSPVVQDMANYFVANAREKEGHGPCIPGDNHVEATLYTPGSGTSTEFHRHLDRVSTRSTRASGTPLSLRATGAGTTNAAGCRGISGCIFLGAVLGAASILAYVRSVEVQIETQAPYRRAVITNCKRVAQTLWPRSSLELYGSYASGLGLRTSGLDLLLKVHPSFHGFATSETPEEQSRQLGRVFRPAVKPPMEPNRLPGSGVGDVRADMRKKRQKRPRIPSKEWKFMFNRPWLSDHSTTPDEAIEAALSPIEEDDEQLRQLKLEEVSPAHSARSVRPLQGWQQQLSDRLAKEKWVVSDSIRVAAHAAIPVLSFAAAPEVKRVSPENELSFMACQGPRCCKRLVPKELVFGPGSTRVDICLHDSGYRGLRSKALINFLLNRFPLARPVTLVLKQWLIEQAYSMSHSGGLCSYGLLLMVIAFLQYSPANTAAAALRRQCGSERLSPAEEPDELASTAGDNEEAHRFDPLLVAWPSALRTWGSVTGEMLQVEDPVNPTNNVGRNCFRIRQIQRSLARAADLISGEVRTSSVKPCGNDLIAPCLCKGTTKWVHRKCLDQWRANGQGRRTFTHCPNCQFAYLMQLVRAPTEHEQHLRERRRKLLRHAVGTFVLGALLIQLLLILVAIVIRALDPEEGLVDMMPFFQPKLPDERGFWMAFRYHKSTYYFASVIFCLAVTGLSAARRFRLMSVQHANRTAQIWDVAP
ncbi:unnamed protein product [Durusdinium trenchii]|uniref:RING-CH-type domain-containing protein n=1 Tax=Durusdinium trenchii TaxID=1381693 RepID=A0ABP0L269_9DINO